MLRCTPSTASDPQLGADGHVPIIGGRSGTIQTWLRKQRAVGLPIHLARHLQSVQNAAARLICRLRRFNHVTDALVSLHWLRVPERVVYKIAVLTFKVLHGIAPEYLEPCRRSAGTNRLVVPPFKLSTIGTRAFPVANPRVWNSLPSAPSLSTFRQVASTTKNLSILTIISASHHLIICTLLMYLAVTFT